ncbi:MAG: class I mannose-6-phosphate isomerase [Lentisphaerae bacterium]|nr:class I mannose-6-phosphate isomerase [Lentisphaerota bacterium]
MKLESYPLLFEPVYKDYLWGGERIRELYGRTGTPEVCAESWEVSTRPEGMSVVNNGVYAGLSLAELVRRYQAELVGVAAPQAGEFPLLFKVIDARERLSVQVHPDNAGAAEHGGEAKNEMWVVLECNPGATLFAGFKNGATAESLCGALAGGSAATLLNEMAVQRGDALYIPGGLVHAIGSGNMIYEVQQNSNTTYRLYDWERRDKNGQMRQLHIEEALRVINWGLGRPEFVRHVTNDPTCTTEGNRCYEVVNSPYFKLKRFSLSSSEAIGITGDSFRVLFVKEGRVAVTSGGCTVDLTAGMSCLIPAMAGSVLFEPDNSAELLVTALPYD